MDADKPALESPWNSMVTLKKRVGRWSYSVIRLYPAAETSRVFEPVFDDLACSYKNEGSISFTRSTLFLSSFSVLPSPFFRGSDGIVLFGLTVNEVRQFGRSSLSPL